MRQSKILALLLSALLVAGLLPASAFAADTDAYVLMNIPYADFYKAELGENDASVDAVSSSTLNKPRTGTLAGGSYHKNADGTDISGVIYPVLVRDESLLEGLTRVTEDSKVEITVTNRGQESTTVYEGADALFESPDYSYYVLTEAPTYYKELTGSAGSLSFSAVKGEARTVKDVAGEVTLGGRHTDIEIVLTGTEVAENTVVNGVVLTTSDGAKYGLRHVYNIWRGTQLGWNLDEAAGAIGGKTVTNIRYITRDSVVDYPVSLTIGEAGYVLMDIPYADFYRAELGENGDVDAISAATANKRGNGGLAKGSYHVGAEGAGIDGVIYPVFVPDLSLLDIAKEITDESSVTVSSTARGVTTETTYEGKDALFEADNYSWYALNEKPALSKKLTVGEDGAWSFGAISGRARTISGVTADITYNGRHTDIELVLSGTEGIQTGDAVSAVIVTTADGAKYGLGHVTNIWRAVQLGWDDDDVMKAGKDAVSITNIRYITQDAIIDFPVEINIEARGEAGFTDLAEDAWYSDAAAWAVEKKYLSNRGDGHFDAEKVLTRSEVVTYLWNAAGSPEPSEGTANPFADVAEDAGYYKAVLWALENGVTNGTAADTFSPEGTVKRGELVSFLWKEAKKPESTAGNPFKDVSEDAWYREAVLWAVENGITQGTSADAFSPGQEVNLGQVVTFLYRYGNLA